ncbi:MAG: site-specific integrase [Acidobacteria bacterium]|nr:site-specific integrase [Acidobacteriota bacterium]
MKPHQTAILSFQRLVQDFFEKHLAIERNACRNTVLAYRDALKLFLLHTAQQKGCKADQLDATIFDVDTVRCFLAWLEQERKCCARTRNNRLAALKAFARYIASVAPEHLERCRRLRELPPARFEHPEVPYLEDDEIVQLLRAVAPTQQRDRALLLLLYNTGARVQEIVDLDLGHLRLDPIPVVTLMGKGRKPRTCPLWKRTVEALKAWLSKRGNAGKALFLNAHGQRLSRSGIAHILSQLAARADIRPRHAARLSPHVIRHTTAMHLLQAGVDITTTAAWLGHSQINTTHGYVEITLRMKQKALAAMTPLPELAGGSFPEDDVLTWLEALGRSPRYAHSSPTVP